MLTDIIFRNIIMTIDNFQEVYITYYLLLIIVDYLCICMCMWITVPSFAYFSIHMLLKPCKDSWNVNKWMNGALYTYINVCTDMHSHWKLLHPLCSWSGYVPGQSVLALSLSRGPYPVFILYGIHWLVGQRVWVFFRCTHQGWTNEWARQAGAQGTKMSLE